METKSRSLVKALIWNVIGMASMSLVGFLATGSAAVGGATPMVNTAVGFVMYLFYERVWAGIRWGRRHV